MSPTPQHQELIDAIREVLIRDDGIEAAWLGGSLGRGAGDAYSDVDIVVLVQNGKATQVGETYAANIAEIAEPALVNSLFGGRVLSVVTTEWARFDLSFIEPGELARFEEAHLRELFNRGDRSPSAPPAKPYRVSPETLRKLVNEFLRVLGLSVVGAGREEWLVALSGIDILRRLTLELMLEENGVSPVERGGALRRNPLLAPDQRKELEALNPVRADRAGVINANSELAAIFLPRARRLADRIGMDWPHILERATREHLRTRLGVVMP